MEVAESVAKEGGEEDVEPKTERFTEEKGKNRKEKRKEMKKMKRKQTRKEIALKEREEEEAILNDPEELMKIRNVEKEEAERSERERKLFEERERAWIEAMEIKRKKQIEEEEKEEERRIKALEEEEEEELSRKQQVENANDGNEIDDWEYVEEGPAEIIWKGNEIIVKKKRVKVQKGNADQQSRKEDSGRPTSNPLPPQSEAFSDYTNSSMSAQQLIENVAQQVPHFGTEQDKAHCPFHLKTGACRFGQHCSRVHFCPDKSSTLLIKNMYNGPGLVWEQDEGLERFICDITLVEFHGFGLGCIEIEDIPSSFVGNILVLGITEAVYLFSSSIPPFEIVGGILRSTYVQYTDEEVERSYEEFYEDVHTEFLKFGEIINFKVSRNGSFHLRGNVYIHYQAVDSAVLAHQSINGRYFAGKQISCEFINVTRWKVALCGEYMKSRYKTCSHGTACNFIHCFRNPGGDYEWADGDRPPPKYWVRKMVALFGYSAADEKQIVRENYEPLRNSSKMSVADYERYSMRKSRSRERDYSRRYDNDHHVIKGTGHRRRTGDDKHQGKALDEDMYEDNKSSKDYHHRKSRKYDTESDGELLDRETDRDGHHGRTRKRSRRQNWDHKNKNYETEDDGDLSRRDKYRDKYHGNRRSSGHERKVGCPDNHKDSENRARDTDGEWSDCNREGDEHHSRRKNVGRIRKASKFLSLGDRSTRSGSTEVSDVLEDDAGSHPSDGRKKSKCLGEVSDFSDGDRVPVENLKHGHDGLSREMRHGVRKRESSRLSQEEDRWEPEHKGRDEPSGSDFDTVSYYYDKVDQKDRYVADKETGSKHRRRRRKSSHRSRRHSSSLEVEGEEEEEATDSSEDNKESARKHKRHRSRGDRSSHDHHNS